MRASNIISEVFGPIRQQTAREIEENLALFDTAMNMSRGQADTLVAAFERGPLPDGDVPCPSSRNALVDMGMIDKVVVMGRDGFNACTHRGAFLYRLHRAIVREGRAWM